MSQAWQNLKIGGTDPTEEIKTNLLDFGKLPLMYIITNNTRDTQVLRRPRVVQNCHFKQLQGTPKKSKELRGTPKNSKELQGSPRNSKELQGTPRNSTELQRSPRKSKELQGTPRSSKELNGEDTEQLDR